MSGTALKWMKNGQLGYEQKTRKTFKIDVRIASNFSRQMFGKKPIQIISENMSALGSCR